MAQGTGIEWTEATWNPVAGCTPISPGCLNCYAARLALRLARMNEAGCQKYCGTAKRHNGRPVFTGRINIDEAALDLPRRWRKGKRIFVNSMSDLFHEAVTDEFIGRVFRVMNECPQHQFQVLTKRPGRAKEMADSLRWTPNIWMGTSVENAMYTWRIKELVSIKTAHVRFLSCEPLIGPIPKLPLAGIHWVIVGGESGPGARPMEAEWVEQIRDRCVAKGVAFFFKQWGGVQKHRTGRRIGLRTWDQMPRGERLGATLVG